jgi:hypothetical protein
MIVRPSSAKSEYLLLVDFGRIVSRAAVDIETAASSLTEVGGASLMEVDRRVDRRRVITCEELLGTDELWLLVLFLVVASSISSNVCGGSEMTFSGLSLCLSEFRYNCTNIKKIENLLSCSNVQLQSTLIKKF